MAVSTIESTIAASAAPRRCWRPERQAAAVRLSSPRWLAWLTLAAAGRLLGQARAAGGCGRAGWHHACRPAAAEWPAGLLECLSRRCGGTRVAGGGGEVWQTTGGGSDRAVGVALGPPMRFSWQMHLLLVSL